MLFIILLALTIMAFDLTVVNAQQITPLHPPATITSMDFTAEILSSTPYSGIIITSCFDYTMPKLSFLNESFYGGFVIAIPINGRQFQIAVYDGKGQCREIFENLTTDWRNYAGLGVYCIDYANYRIILYPRPTEDGGICRYNVKSIVTIAPQTDSNVSFWEPYRGNLRLGHKYTFTNDTSIDGNVINLHLTGHVIAKFIFPSDVTPVMYDPENSTIGEENGKGTLTYVYNSPISMPKTPWMAYFNFNIYKTFFENQLFNVFLLSMVAISIFIVRKFLRTIKKWLIGLIPSLGSIGWVINNYKDWYLLGWYKPSVILLMAIEGCLVVVIMALLILCYRDIPNRPKNKVIDYAR
jgi:hypothetical protein